MNWNDAFSLLTEYKKEFGNTAVPFSFIYHDFALGHWTAKQKNLFKMDKLSEEKKNLLVSLDGSVGTRAIFFETMLALATEYFHTYQNLEVPKRYVVNKDGKKYLLGKWVQNLRTYYKDGKLSSFDIDRLEAIGMKWNNVATFHKVSFNESAILYYVKSVYPDACKYFKDGVELDVFIPSLNVAIEYDGKAFHNAEKDHNKNLYCQKNNISIIRIREIGCDILDDGISKDYYINSRDNKDLERVISDILGGVRVNIALDTQEIYDTYNSTLSVSWKKNYAICKKYLNIHGNLLVPQKFSMDGKNIGQWILSQRKNYRNGTLSNERIALLEEIGMVWNTREKIA